MSLLVRNCITTTVTMRGLCESRNDALTYLNDVPGVRNQLFELLTTEDHDTGEKVFDSIAAHAAAEFTDLVRSIVAERFVERTIFSDAATGYWVTPHEDLIAAANTLNGVYITLEESPYMTLHLADAEIYIGTPGSSTETLRIIDLDKGTDLDTITFDGSSTGFLRIPIQKYYFGVRKIFIGYDGAIPSRRVSQYGTGHWKNLCESCGSLASWAVCSTLDSTGTLTYDTIQTGQTCGLKVSYGIGCSLEPWICSNRVRFAVPFKHLMAMILFENVKASPRLNSATLIKRSDLDENYSLAKARLERGLNAIVNGSKFNCAFCLPCSPKKTRVVHFMP